MLASLSLAISMENPVKQLSCCLLSNHLQMHVSFQIINRYEIVFMQCASPCHQEWKPGKLGKKITLKATALTESAETYKQKVSEH